MKSQVEVSTNFKQKAVVINLLYATTIIIILLGVSFIVYSMVNNVSFKVINSSVHGAVFGLVVAYLGARYFLSVTKLKTELYKSTSQFSWSNFKKEKKKKK
ncbi:hypothetical protein [[Clostridium] fimetarium]|uniref:Uncharacterized protein n=1 Tax=[Clostridium] fimetarium TaxID=99656 RepID=A0A1I0NJ97_9FIRM|nr:hypothetical protein [[Clostridium] fimetarium]SEW01317.1 hypothetical protein SAMN05421659_103140 [[Clostridium] fimetarium]